MNVIYIIQVFHLIQCSCNYGMNVVYYIIL